MKRIPVLITGYNRPTSLTSVINQISIHSKVDLYISVDGPKNNSNDLKLVNDCRDIAKYATKHLDAKILLHKNNLGCRNSMTNSINWFFKNNHKGVILEDDLLLHSDFLEFMENALTNFENDFSVGSVAGYNSVPKSKITNQQTIGYFTNFSSSWGWGTWRNRWEKNISNLTNWENLISKKELKSFGGKNGMKRWINILNRVKNQELDSWAYPWLLTQWVNGYFTFTSTNNLVENLGFAPDSTHTKKGQSAGLYKGRIDFESKLANVKHEIDYKAEEWILRNNFFVLSNMQKIRLRTDKYMNF